MTLSRSAARKGTAVAAMAVALLAGTASDAQARTYMVDGGWQRLVFKPVNWAAGGVGASARMEDISWKSWGSRRASARGTTVNNDCDPSCAEGTIVRYPGSLRLDRPASCRYNGRTYRFFRRVRYTINLPEDNAFDMPAGPSTTTFTWSKRDLDRRSTCAPRSANG